MTFYFMKGPAFVLARADWTAQVLDQEKLVLLFINYTFFSIIVMTFILFLMCLTQVMSVYIDMYSLMTLLAVCFILVNITVADYLVHTMHFNREIKLFY